MGKAELQELMPSDVTKMGWNWTCWKKLLGSEKYIECGESKGK